MVQRCVLTFVFLGLLFAATSAAADDEAWRLYLDADRTSGTESADAIAMGVAAALAEHGNEIAGRPVELIPHDHRSNTKRSLLNMRAFDADPNGLAVIGGVQSSPYLNNSEEINARGIPLLLPWSAAAPLTRPASGENYVFRLSVDDRKAARFLVDAATKDGACRRPALVLTNTAWGRSNEILLLDALADAGVNATSIVLFDRPLTTSQAHLIADRMARKNVDCIILLAATQDGAAVIHALDTKGGGQISVLSHWGILLGDFAALVSAEVRERVNLRVIQTCGLEREAEGNQVIDRLFNGHPYLPLAEYSGLSAIPSSVGFVHAYDLTKVLIAAADDIDTTGSIHDTRSALREALETLDGPVEGILRSYVHPFAPWTGADPDAHEALRQDDLCLSEFAPDGRIQPARDLGGPE